MIRAPIRRPHGLTLMETLVMLVLVGFAVLLMFQMLGSYRIARERVQAQAGGMDREALFAAWLSDSIGGLHPTPGTPLAGEAMAFRGATLNPLFASPGAPVAVEWRIDRATDGRWQVHYAEAGVPRWQLPLRAADAPRFAYLDASGDAHDSWPPRLGLQAALPMAIALVRGDGDAAGVQVAAVRGPRDAVELPYQLEQE